MYNFGNSGGHGNIISFGNLADLDAPTKYTFFMWLTINALPAEYVIFCKRFTSGGYWQLNLTAAGVLRMYHYDGATQTGALSTLTMSGGNTYFIGVSWSGSNITFQRDTTFETVAFTRAITTNAGAVSLGNVVSYPTNGAAVRIGLVSWYKDGAFSQAEMLAAYAGHIVRPEKLKFLVFAEIDPGFDFISGTAGVKTGTVTITEANYATRFYPFDLSAHTQRAATVAAPQAGLLPPALKTEFQKAGPKVFTVLILGLPTGEERYCSAGLRLGGNYESRVLFFGSSRTGVQLVQNSLSSREMEIEIEDLDFHFAQVLYGDQGHLIWNCSAEVRIVTEGASYTRFLGRLRTPDEVSPLRWKLVLTPNDLPLGRKIVRVPITLHDFPKAHSTALGHYAPLIWGDWNSTGLTNEGAVSTLYVKSDANPFRYLVCLGAAKAVTAVYKGRDTITKLAASAYNVNNNLVVNGKRFTVIEFTTDQGNPETSPIMCDIQGYETIGDGTGDLIRNPVEQIRHCLDNFIYSDIRSGNWVTGVAPVDPGSFQAAVLFANDEGYEGAIRLSEPTKGIDVLNAWLKTFEARAYWSDAGNIVFVNLDHRLVDLFKDDPWIRCKQQESSFSLRHEVSAKIDRITGEHLYNEVRGSFLQTLEVRDTSLDEEAPDTLQLTYGPARLL